MYITTTGLILRETEYMESSRILTVLTPDSGKITVSAKGVKRKNSKNAASTQFLAFSEMTLSNTRGRWTLADSRSLELFEGLREDVEKLSLGAYFAEVLETVTDENSIDPGIMPLALNSLYALSEGIRDRDIIKAAFEMRVMCLCGFAPMAEACYVCGEKDMEKSFLSLSEGAVYCEKCAPPAEIIPLDKGALDALRHIISSEMKKIFSFRLNDEAKKRLSRACEEYLKHQLDRKFRTLDFYYSIKQ